MDPMVLDPVVAVVLVPASMLTGFAAASMSFTAWNLVCPLLFSVFGLTVFQSLFVSVMLDVTNGLALTYIYGRNGNVDFRYALTFGIVSVGWAVLVSALLDDWIELHQDKLKSAVSFVPLLIAFQFLIRGLLAIRKKRREAKEAAAAAAAAGEDSTAVVDDHTTDARTRAKSAVSALVGEPLVASQDVYVTEPLHINDFVVVTGGLKDADSRSRRNSLVGGVDAEGAPLIPGDAEKGSYGSSTAGIKSSINGASESDGDSLVGHGKASVRRLLASFKPNENIIAQQEGSKTWRVIVTLIVHTILGCVSGVLYAGGGMFFANVIVNFWSAKVRTAAGTGCFLMTMVMLSMSFTFIGKDDLKDIVNFYHLLIALPFGVLGAILGAKLALRISDLLMYFVIVGVSLVLFTVIAINGIFA